MNRRALTLYEVIAALVVLGIISAASVRVLPDLLNRSGATRAEVNLDRAVLAETTYAARYGSYTDDASTLPTLTTGRELTLTAGASSGPEIVSVSVGSDGSLVLAVSTSDGRCLGTHLEDSISGGVRSTIPTTTPTSCSAVQLRDQI